MNKVKEKLERGETVVMVNPNYPSPGIVEFIGKLGFDVAFIDTEHGPIGMERIEDMVRAAKVAGISTVLRPAENNRPMIVRYLDRGVDGLMVPHVDTAEAAERIVETVRYARFENPDDTLILAMIESPEAIANLDGILAVDGIDMVFIGPSDLSQTMGFPGQPNHPEVAAAMDVIITKALAAGKPVGAAVDWNNTRPLIEKGVRYVYVHANRFLESGGAAFQALVTP